MGIDKRTIIQTVVIGDASCTLHPTQERGCIQETADTCYRTVEETVGQRDVTCLTMSDKARYVHIRGVGRDGKVNT